MDREPIIYRNWMDSSCYLDYHYSLCTIDVKYNVQGGYAQDEISRA